MIGVVLIAVIGVVAWSVNKGSDNSGSKEGVPTEEEVVAAGDPIDIASAFYNTWLSAVQDPTVSPYTSGVLDDPLLSAETRAYIEAAQEADATGGVDPVLCQTNTPKRVGSKMSFSREGLAEILVFGRGFTEKSSEQAAVTMKVVDGAWQITDIFCASGESMPEREFSFEKEGYLLKSVPEPLDSRYWHLVFEQNGELGHTVPLFFDVSSTCIELDESEAECEASNFVDAQKVFLQAQMTEAGANVKRLKFLLED